LEVIYVLVELFVANCLFVKLRSYDTSKVSNRETSSHLMQGGEFVPMSLLM
jgi:hypothetical protein